MSFRNQMIISQIPWNSKRDTIDAMAMGVGDERDDGRRSFWLADKVRGRQWGSAWNFPNAGNWELIVKRSQYRHERSYISTHQNIGMLYLTDIIEVRYLQTNGGSKVSVLDLVRSPQSVRLSGKSYTVDCTGASKFGHEFWLMDDLYRLFYWWLVY